VIKQLASLNISNINTSGFTWSASGLQPLAYASYIELWAGSIYLGSSGQIGINETSTGSYAASGLSSGTTYSLTAKRYRTSNYYLEGTFSGSVTTSSPPATPPTAPSGLYTDNIFMTSITFHWTNNGSYDSLHAELMGGGNTLDEWISTTSTSKTYYGLTPNTSYYFELFAVKNGLYSNLTNINESTLAGQLSTPTINSALTTKTNSSVHLVLNTVSNAQYYLAIISGNSQLWYDSYGVFDFSGLSASTQYTITFRAENDSNYQDSEYGTYTFTTLSAAMFSWSTDFTLPANAQITNKTGKRVIVQAWEWNDFTSKINQKRVAKGLSNYSFTSAVSDANFTSSYLSQAIAAINAMNPSISTPPNALNAYAFTRLRDSLNSIT